MLLKKIVIAEDELGNPANSAAEAAHIRSHLDRLIRNNKAPL